MQIIKKTIKINSNTTTNIQLNSDFIQYGDDQGIDSLINIKKDEIINPVNDVELIKYKYEDLKTESGDVIMHHIQFYFNQINTLSIPPISFENIFTKDEILKNSKSYLNSFFIVDLYDTKNVFNGNKLSTTYLTRNENRIFASYQLNNYIVGDFIVPVNQLNNIYLPNNFINSFTGNSINCYCKIMFYNAKSGNTITFFNKQMIGVNDSSKLFFDIEINKDKKTWKFINQNFLSGSNNIVIINAIEPNKNNLYNKRINDGVDNFNNKIENYPSGTTFNYDDINYI